MKARPALRGTMRGVIEAALAVAAVALASPAAAQEPAVEARVDQIAGTDLYLSAGTDQGVTAGAVLTVLGAEGEASPGRLRVIEATASRSIATFAGEPFSVTRGATLRLQVETGGEAVTGAAAAAVTRVGEQAPTRRGASSGGPRLHGSLGLSFDGRRTVTTWEEQDIQEVERTFSTPTAALNLRISDLPGGLEFRTSLRASYRASTGDFVQPQDFVRVYSVQIRKDFGMVQASVGRLYNPYEPMTGYFDGAYVHVGRTEGFGLGATAGLRPSRENGGITDSIPRYSLFANYSDRTGPLRYDAAVSFTQEMPGADTLYTHTYLGLTQTFRTGPIRLRHSMTVDRDPTDDTWRMGRLLLGASAPLVGGLTVHARYSLRQPYHVEEVIPVTYRRDGANLGLTYAWGPSVVGADATANDVEGDGRDRSLTYSGWFSVAETPVWRLGFTGTVSYRDRDGDRLLYAAPGLTRRFGPTYARATYTFYRSEEPAAEFTTHSGDLSVDFPLAARLRGTLAARVQRGAQLDGEWVYASLWWAF